MINEVYKTFNGANFAANGDWADELATYFSMSVYILGAIFLMSSPFLTGNFECRVPAEFKSGQWQGYMKQLCYIKNSWYVPFEENINDMVDGGDAFEVTYYQWIPFYLVASAVLFCIPYLFWTSVASAAGMDLDYLTKEASQFNANTSGEMHIKKCRSLAAYIDRYLDNQGDPDPDNTGCWKTVKGMFSCFNNNRGTMMGNAYFVSKIMSIIIMCFQLWMVCKFIGANMIFYSFEYIFYNNIFTHSFAWRPMEVFPLVTFCNITRQAMFENSHTNWIQCSMPNNIFNERYFVFLTFWLILCIVCMGYSTLAWFNRIFLNIRRERFVKNLIKVSQPEMLRDFDHKDKRERLQDFASWYLLSDGAFVFHMILDNTNPIVASEIMVQLWLMFDENYAEEAAFRKKLFSKPRKSTKQAVPSNPPPQSKAEEVGVPQGAMGVPPQGSGPQGEPSEGNLYL